VRQREGEEDYRYTFAPLNVAVISEATEAMAYLLEDCKVDPNIANNLGERALYDALRTKQTDCLRLLLKHGADVNAPTADGTSPLMLAVQQNHEESLNILLDHGDCDVDYTDDEGLSALSGAIFDENWHFAKTLLERGARPLFMHSDGWIMWLDTLLASEEYEDAPEDFVKMAKAIVGEAYRTSCLLRSRQIEQARHTFIINCVRPSGRTRSKARLGALAQMPSHLRTRVLDESGRRLKEPEPLPRVTLSPLPPPPRRSKRKRTEAEVEEEERKMKEKETCLAVLEYTLGVQEQPMWVTEREEERGGRPRRRMIDEHYIELMEMMLPAWDNNEYKRGKKKAACVVK
jgi:hypothetical protein